MNANIRDGAAEAFRFGYGEAQIGRVLVASSPKGIVAILLGDDRAKLRAELSRYFPEARFVEDETGLGDSISKVVAFVDDPARRLDLPLDARGTELELSVWEALRAIPAGETRTYGALAKTLPLTATAQEVGAACAANRIAVAIPCHRVLKADGSISGYRWGVWRKRRLLKVEGALEAA
jgi:AraC family transcriptional regulator of adaptative response/methylated-DNA-[protein]-cysteine methyltransferase